MYERILASITTWTGSPMMDIGLPIWDLHLAGPGKRLLT
jgi:hypothetical protein